MQAMHLSRSELEGSTGERCEGAAVKVSGTYKEAPQSIRVRNAGRTEPAS
jgi:hypothetical protein